MSNKFTALLEQIRIYADQVAEHEDIQLKLDTIEGQTDALEWLDWIYEKIRYEDFLQKDQKERMENLANRKKASENRQTGLREMMGVILKTIGEDKIQRPEFTVSFRSTPTKIDVVNENAIPEEYFRIARSVDKTALKKALESGFVVEGVTLKTGEQTISIRSK